MFNKLTIGLLSVAALQGCGGGSDTDNGNQQGNVIVNEFGCWDQEGLPANCTPSANAGSDTTISYDAFNYTLEHQSTDSYGSLDRTSELTAVWNQVAGPTVAISRYQSGTYYFNVPEKKWEDQILSFELTVTDPYGANDSDVINLTVPKLNRTVRDDGIIQTELGCHESNGDRINCPPLIQVSDDIIAEYLDTTVSFRALASDADSEELPTIVWNQISGPSVMITIPNGLGAASITVPEKTDSEQVIVLRATATDSAGESAFADLNISVPALLPSAFVMDSLNDTGLTDGANAPTGLNVGCTGETIGQQDCSHGRDSTHFDNSDGLAGFSFTKLSEDGTELASNAYPWACIKDNVTGLIWEHKVTDSSSVHWVEKLYYRSAVEDHLNALNAKSHCGISDWRLPTAVEGQSILIYGDQHSFNPDEFDFNYFADLEDFWLQEGLWIISTYWKSLNEGYSFSQDTVVAVHKPGVDNSSLGKVSYYNGNFTLSDTAEDARTDLEWTRCLNTQQVEAGSCGIIEVNMTWPEVLQYVETLNATTGFAGHSDWRLPNVKEIFTLYTGTPEGDMIIASDVFPWGDTEVIIPTSTIDGSLFVLSLVTKDKDTTRLDKEEDKFTSILLVRDL